MTKRICGNDDGDYFTPMVLKFPEVMCQLILVGYVEAHLPETYRGDACLMVSKTLNDFLTTNNDMMVAMLDLEQEYWCERGNIAFYKQFIVNESHFFDMRQRRALMKSSLRNLLNHHTKPNLLKYIYTHTIVIHLRRYRDCGGWDGREYEEFVDRMRGPCPCIQCREKYFLQSMDSYVTSLS